MKKLLCIALFSIAIMANATEKKEIVTNDFKEVKVEINESSSEFETVKNDLGCGKQGNNYYSLKRSEGMSHREARAYRRAYVRKCRNYFWQFQG